MYDIGPHYDARPQNRSVKMSVLLNPLADASELGPELLAPFAPPLCVIRAFFSDGTGCVVVIGGSGTGCVCRLFFGMNSSNGAKHCIAAQKPRQHHGHAWRV